MEIFYDQAPHLLRDCSFPSSFFVISEINRNHPILLQIINPPSPNRPTNQTTNQFWSLILPLSILPMPQVNFRQHSQFYFCFLAFLHQLFNLIYSSFSFYFIFSWMVVLRRTPSPWKMHLDEIFYGLKHFLRTTFIIIAIILPINVEFPTFQKKMHTLGSLCFGWHYNLIAVIMLRCFHDVAPILMNDKGHVRSTKAARLDQTNSSAPNS